MRCSRPVSAGCTSASARSSRGASVASPPGRSVRSGARPTEPARRAPLRSVAAAAKARAGEPRELDELLHHRIRLGIVSALAGSEVLTFVELRALLGVTDGNLSVHARKLEEARYVRCSKSFAGRRPRTEYRLADL